MAEKVSAAERPRGAGSSCSGSSSGSETLSEEGEPGAGPAAGRRRPGEEPGSPGEREEAAASLEERDEELDHILSPPPMPFRKSSNPEVISGPGKPFKFKRQLSEDGRQLRRGSLGGALTGRYLLPSANGQQLWQPAETSNLVRMRCQALGQSAPSLTASLVRHALLLSAKAVLLAEQDCKDDFIHVAFRVQVQKELSLPRRGSLGAKTKVKYDS